MKYALARFSAILDVVCRVALWLGGIGLVLMTVSVGWQVWGRFVLNDSPSWTEPFALLMMLWFILLVAAVGVRERFHLGLDLIRDIVSERVRVGMDVASFVCVGGFGVAMCRYSLDLVAGTWSAAIPVLGIPESFNYLPLTVAGALIAVFSIERVWRLLVDRHAETGAQALANAHQTAISHGAN